MLIDKHQFKHDMDEKTAQRGLRMITLSQDEMTIWLGSCAQNETKMP